MRTTILLQTSFQSKVHILLGRSYGPPKLRESQFKKFWDSKLGVLGQNDIWMLAPWPGIENTIRGKVLAFPKLTFGSRLIGVPQGHSNPSANGSSHFQWGRKVDFYKSHCFSYLFGKALIATIITSRFLLDFRSFLLEVIGANGLWPLLFQMDLILT